MDQDPSRNALAASIVIPAWNAACFIEATLRSACAQTERRIEVLVVDDCSTDDTAAVVERFSRIDPRVRLLRTPVNGGPSRACNVGFAAAQGDWIAILDADDAYEPDRIEALCALGEAQAAELVTDNLLRVFEDGAPSEPLIPTTGGERTFELTLRGFFEGNIRGGKRRATYGYLQPMFRRAFLERHGLRFDETMRLAEDFDFYVRCMLAGGRWWVTTRPMYRCLIRAGSLSEAHGPADVDPLRRLDQRLLQAPIVVADPALARVIRRHLAGLDRYRHYRPFTDAVKARSWGAAARTLFGSFDGFRLILLESLLQVPAVTGKALRGGYRRRVSTSPAG
jgi:succinoglycan biosynthesis protein ExoO/succinoglycan biosynthesis protein ExoU